MTDSIFGPTHYQSNCVCKTVGKDVGVPTEIKNGEGRVALVPNDVHTLIKTVNCITVRVQSGAGLKSGYSDKEYLNAGAIVVPTADELYQQSNVIIKVKEPQPEDMRLMPPSTTLFGYLHLAPDPNLISELLKKNITSIALEHIEAYSGTPFLNPMSEIAGKIAIQMGTVYLYTSHNGKGILLGGIGGTPRGNVTILGAGCAGRTAATLAANMGAKVVIFDKNPEALRLAHNLHSNVEACFISDNALYDILPSTDLLVGAVLVPGTTAPKIVSRDMIKCMSPGSVVVDISADQGGCIETIRPTTHTAPSYIDEGVIHVAIQNLPGAVPKTSSIVLSGVIMQHIKHLLGTVINSDNAEAGATLLDKSVCTIEGRLIRT